MLHVAQHLAVLIIPASLRCIGACHGQYLFKCRPELHRIVLVRYVSIPRCAGILRPRNILAGILSAVCIRLPGSHGPLVDRFQNFSTAVHSCQIGSDDRFLPAFADCSIIGGVRLRQIIRILIENSYLPFCARSVFIRRYDRHGSFFPCGDHAVPICCPSNGGNVAAVCITGFSVPVCLSFL